MQENTKTTSQNQPKDVSEQDIKQLLDNDWLHTGNNAVFSFCNLFCFPWNFNIWQFMP